MKTIDKLAHKYALNINQIRGPSKSNNLDFKNLNKGFYDEIEKNDILIKQDQKQLKRLKNTSLKEFIYTNKEIPDRWKKKANYEDDLLNIMVEDNNILTYVGTSPKEEDINSKSYNDKRSTKKSFSIDQKNLISINDRYITKKIFDNNCFKKEEGNKNILDSEINNKNIITEEFINDNSISKLSRVKSKNKSKSQLNDKEIYNILEDFKTAYPIKEKLQQLYTKTNYYNTDIKSESNNDNKYLTNELTMTNPKKIIINNNYNNNIKETNGRNTFFSSIKNQQLFKRKNVFRQNVFNNLVSNNASSVDTKFQKKKKLKIEINEKINPFLGTDYKNFIKKIEINNPIVNKNLESINYYGPYFSHCPPCYNRNLNYYKNLEINQCLEIIHHIKKNRMKNTIIDIKKKSNTEKNRPSENNIAFVTHSLKSKENSDYFDGI